MALAFNEAVENCEYFIENFVYIESKEGSETEVKFNLWPKQKETLNDMLTRRWMIFLKARQLGCTWLVLAYAIWLMFRPSKRIIALSKTEPDAWALVARVEFIIRHLPWWFIQKSSNPIPNMYTYDNTLSWVRIRHPSGEDSVFMSLPAAQNSGASLTADVVIFDEWGLMEWAEQIYRASFPTINRPGDKPENGQVFGISTMRIGTFFHKMVLRALHGLNDYKLVFWPWYTDPSRDQKWYDDATRNYEGNMKSDYPATIEEALSQAEGCFFNELDASVHIKPKLKEVPEYFKRYISIDYGLDMLAVLWYYVDDKGWYRVYREIFEKDKIVSAAAALILAENADEDIAGFFAPSDLMFNRKADTGKSLAESFSEFGIYLTKADNRREQGWEQLKELLAPFETVNEQTGEKYMTAKLTIDEGAAPELWRCLTTIQRDPNNYNDVLDRKPEDHALTHMPDSIRYFAAGRTYPSVPGIPNRKRRFPFEEEDTEGDWVKW